MDNATRADRLEAIKEQIAELARDAVDLVRGTEEEHRARAYWYAQLVMALDDDHGYCGRGNGTMQETINSLRHPDDDEEE